MLPTKDEFRRVFGSIIGEAQSQDVLVIYLAGHGVARRGVADQYYFLAKSARGTELPANDLIMLDLASISSEELRNWCLNIKALKQVIILDTCAAGAAIKIIREEVRMGHDASHEKNEAGYVRALSKAGYPNYVGMTTVSGPREAWFIEFYPSYAAVEAARVLTDKQPAKSELDLLDVKDAESVSGGRTLLGVYQKDLSYMPERGPGKLHYTAVSIVRVRVGRDADYAKLRAMTNAAGSTAGRKGSQLVYRVSSGAPGGTYITLRALESLKDLDPDSSVRPLADVMGAAQFAEFQKLSGEVEVSTEQMIFAISPAMRTSATYRAIGFFSTRYATPAKNAAPSFMAAPIMSWFR